MTELTQNKTVKGRVAVTGATGKLGRLIIEDLIAIGVEPEKITAFARDIDKAADLMEKGFDVRHADYSKPETLAAAMEGAEKLMLVSANEVGQRLSQHRNVIGAAKNAGVKLIVYASVLNADSSEMALASEHKATEELIRNSGIPYVFLRNGWYIENYTENLKSVLDYGAVLGSAGEGEISAATRADLAAAAAAVLTGDGHENKTYELGGDEGFTLSDLAAEIGRQSGRTIIYKDLPADEYAKALVSAGLPDAYAQMLADSDLGIKRGDLFTESGDLRKLIGRPTTRLSEAVGSAAELKTSSQAA